MRKKYEKKERINIYIDADIKERYHQLLQERGLDYSWRITQLIIADIEILEEDDE